MAATRKSELRVMSGNVFIVISSIPEGADSRGPGNHCGRPASPVPGSLVRLSRNEAPIRTIEPAPFASQASLTEARHAPRTALATTTRPG